MGRSVSLAASVSAIGGTSIRVHESRVGIALVGDSIKESLDDQLVTYRIAIECYDSVWLVGFFLSLNSLWNL